jgi:hypothetical protein
MSFFSDPRIIVITFVGADSVTSAGTVSEDALHADDNLAISDSAC